jgi:hypothetical protein
MNWIESHKEKNGEYPSLPRWLNGYLRGGLSPDEPIHKGLKAPTPSGQFYNNLTIEQKKQWWEMVEWLGQDPEALLIHMRRMLPKHAPSRGARFTN